MLDLKRLLHLPAVPVGGPPSYVLPGVRYVSDHLSIEREGQTPYLKLEDRMYTAEEVRKLVGELLQAVPPAEAGDEDLSKEELSELERRHQARLSGQSKGLPRAESMARLRSRRP